MTESNLPLAGLTVVSLEQAVAAPLATRHLADLGARVIKLERVGEGDFARNYDSMVRGMASHFVWLNRGKESLAVDLKSPEGLLITHRLLARADVFVQNAAPGAAERLGLGAEDLRRANPGLVVANISGYGDAGPYRDRKAYDLLIQAEAGLVSINGTPDDPAKTGIPTSDIASGVYVAQGVLAALLRRERTGVGGVVDVAMLDATAEWLGHQLYTRMYGGVQVPRMRLGHPAIAPYDAYPTSDGEILIGVQNDRGWQTLVSEVLGRPDLATREDLATNQLRVKNRQECDRALATETVRFSTADLSERLAKAGVPSAQVNEIAGLIEHPQLSARNRWREIDSPVGPLQALLPVTTFRDVELPVGDVPGLGEHTLPILTELGCDPATQADLLARAVVGAPDDGTDGTTA